MRLDFIIVSWKLKWMTSVLFELPRAGVGKVDPSATIIEIPRDRGSTVKSPEMENPNWKKTSLQGYEYFVEPYIECF